LKIPIYDAVKKYSSSCPAVFHMPGHKLGRGLPSAFLESLHLLDLTEIPGLDSLHYPKGVIEEAQTLAAQAFGADRTFFLVNGSTCGIQATIMTLCRPGDKIIIARDCHRSAIAGMMLSGATPVYIKPDFNGIFDIPSVVSVNAVEKALKENPDAVGVYITRPNYYGVCSDIKAIVELVHSYNKPVIVDEAHGAHLCFSSMLPPSSLEYGADICVQSAHKTLPAFTQGSYLHVRGTRTDLERLKFNLSILQTSSPSYIIMAFLDIARAIMQQDGENRIQNLLREIELLSEIVGKGNLYKILSENDIEGGSIDKTRVVVNVRNTGKTGFEIEKLLRNQYNIQVEMSDLYNIVCIATVADTHEDIKKLGTALEQLRVRFKKAALLGDAPLWIPKLPEQRIDLGSVMNRTFTRKKLTDALQCVSRSMITPYPPGIPVICPGEVISKDTVEYIREIIEAGGTVNGISDDLEVDVVE
jgi:arginine decarboxylase